MSRSTDSSTTRHLADVEIAAIVYAGPRNAIALVDEARQSHFETCDICRTQVDLARRLDMEAAQLLHVLDLPAPRFEVTTVIGRVRRRRWSARGIGRYSGVAASVLVCVLGAVAFALPTSSLGRALKQMIGLDRTVPKQTASTHVQSSTTPPRVSGIALNATGPLTIEFRGGMPSSLQVRYCDTTLTALHVVPRRTSADSGTEPNQDHVRFTVSNSRIRVTTTDVWDDFVLTLPEHTPVVYVTDDVVGPPIVIGPPPSDHVPHGCHAPIIVPLSH